MCIIDFGHGAVFICEQYVAGQRSLTTDSKEVREFAASLREFGLASAAAEVEANISSRPLTHAELVVRTGIATVAKVPN
jgi:hypothetical protein